MGKKKECDNLQCDFKHAIRKGRADYRCPLCGAQLMLQMVLMAEADIKARDFECPVPNLHKNECACASLNGLSRPDFKFHSQYECRKGDIGLLRA